MRFVYKRAEKQDRTTAQKAMRSFLKSKPAEFMRTMATLEEEYRAECAAWSEKNAAASVADVPGGVGVQEAALRKVLDDLLSRWQGS